MAAVGAEQAGDDIPSTIREIFNDLERRSNAMLMFAPQARDKRSHKIGDIQWDENNRNWDAVSTAVLSVKMSDFASDWERLRFCSAYRHWYANLRALQRDRWILDASQLLLARQFGIIDRLPDLLEDDISDRNKGDLFVKL